MRYAAAYVAALLGAAAIAVFGLAWYYTGVLEDAALRPDHAPPAFDLRIEAVGEGSVTLAAAGADDGDWRRPGVWGLEWPGGYARVARVLASEPDRVTRELTPVAGLPQPGAAARIHSDAYRDDPLRALGLPFLAVAIPSEIGELPAWFVPASGDARPQALVVIVHGKDAGLAQALRVLPTLHGLGLPVLVTSYRRDGIAPDAPGRYRLGEDEWRDVEAAVQYARGLAAADGIVLYGFSMGGAIIMSFMERSALAAEVEALVLDAPLLDFGAAVDYGAERRGLPEPLTLLAKWLAARRFDLDWSRLDYAARARETIAVPVLIFHGEEDTTIPVRSSEALARKLSGLVTLHRCPGVEHVRCWNADPAAYEESLRSFLRRALR